MVDAFSARRLEQEIDTLISRAIKVGRGGAVDAFVDGRATTYTVDRLVADESGFPSEIWLSAPTSRSWWGRLMDRMRGIERRELMRVMREAGDVRRTRTTLEIGADGVVHVDYREEIGAPRVSRSVASFNYPRGDAATWMHSYRRAG